MRKLMLFFTALMLTLGVKAQEGSTVAERGAAKGYYPFAAEVTEMEQITSLNQLTDGMEIMIKHSHEGTDQDDHDGSYLTINSLNTGGEGGYHNVFMHSIPTGVGVWTTDAVGDGSYRLKSAHMTIVDGAKCYLGYPRYDSNLRDDVITTIKNDNFSQCTYNFETSGDGRWALKYTYVTRNYMGTVLSQSSGYLCVTSTSGKIKIVSSSTLNANCYFNVYQVKEKSATQNKYVEATVKLTGAAGNVFTTEHEGWSDFYEFNTASYDSYSNYKVLNNHGVILSNIYYHDESNEITGNISFPFSVSGKIAQIPVHLCSYGNEDKRFTVGENNTVKVITRSENYKEDADWFKNQKNQWYIIPSFDANDNFVYSIQNVATKQYLYSELNSDDLKLSDTPTYFKLYQTAPSGNVRFVRPRTGTYSTYLSFLCESSSKGHTTTTAGESTNFLVPRVSGEEAGGYDAIGFTRTYHSDTYFWDGGEIAMDDAPAALKAVFEHEDHEGYNTEGSQHHIYTANTGIYVPKMGDVTVTFKYLSGADRLTILGVDIVNAVGEIVSYKYHLGYAGVDESGNEYVVKDVPVGDYHLRYWVCNRTDYEDKKNHDLSRNSGKIVVTGADYDLRFSDKLSNGAFSANTTWFRLRLSDGLEKYISAQPAYMDAKNNLMLANNTPPNDYAGLWAVIGDEENGYKFYNRAWGPEYAMKTVGEDGEARTYMVPAAEASTYDIVQQDRSMKDYKFYVKLHGTANNYLQDFGGYNSTGYLSTWNSANALGDDASVMTFETLNMEVFEEKTEIVKNSLAEKWMPWAAEPEVAPIIDDFAQLMLNRNSFALLDGKVFKFANKGTDVRKDMLLTVNGEGKGAGLTATGNSEDYMQFIDNGDGTFKLFHIATARYLGVPDGAVTTTKSSEAAAYTYTFQDAAHKEQLTFQTSGQTLHLKNVDNYIFMNYGDNDDASRWTVFYGDAEAQKLGAAAIEAQEVLEKITSADYLAKAGQQGYASSAQIEAYQNAIQGLSGKSVAEAMSALETSMNAIEDAEKNIRYIDNLGLIKNTNIYGIHCARGPLAYVAGNSTTKLSTPKMGSANDITANVVKNENEQFAILRTENTPAGWYYLYNITTQKFVSKDFTLTEDPVCAVNFRDISGYDANYRWEVWFGEIINGEKVDQKLNVNQGNGLILDSGAGMDAGNKFRIEYAETNEAKTAPALALINALETAKAEATAFLNSTPETVGYPVAAERTTFANAIVAATSVADVAAVKTAFVTTSSIVMPEDGKAYKISAWWRNNEKWPLTFVENGSDAANCAKPAYAPVKDTQQATVFVCRKLGDGEYAFVSDNGYYLGWLADGKNNNTSKSFSVNGHDNTLMVQKAVANNQSTILTLEEVFGTFNIRGKNTNEGGNYYHLMFSKSSKNYHSAGQNDAYYGDNAHTVFYTFEEVSANTLIEVSLATIKPTDELLTGSDLEGKTIGTFSAPYATVIPKGVTAYYAAKAEEAGQLILKPVDGEALPAEQGVVLIGEASSATMLPVAGEDVATISGNVFEHSATGPVEMGANAYILANGGQGIGIYKATKGSTLKQGKAYLDFGTSTVARFVLNFSGVATDIEGAPTVAPSQQVIYDLSGRRVNAVTNGGIYIVNGKKMIIK